MNTMSPDEDGVAEEWRASANATPVISDLLPVTCLQEEYAGNANANFLHGIAWLDQHYGGLRRVRGDGNCFFRAFIFALCEQLVGAHAKSALGVRVLETIRQSKARLVALGYSEMAIDAFWETFVDYLDFQTEGGESEYLVWYMRLLTAGHLKQHAEQFQPFIEGLFPGQTVAQFCAAEVEPMGKECDQPQIAALTEALGVGVKIEYLDGSVGVDEPLQSYICAPSTGNDTLAAQPIITLLYRPGHYDILYPRSE
ncbi:TPA: hypothetical protein N0F65_003393 [Lagenidium giganteum]|uniref:ubiquitinyl hydrolase 1 n=1 Tax=Lagenidium giganteum TaxID=4803 RepID=A0AAV2YR14_9STRA|nr:TPA: hypothetical protein N0F65_003393 [Lagenidium giganteum]